MNIVFNEITQKALLKEIEKSEHNHIRVKVVAVGCGKPAYDLYADFISDEDFEVTINEVRFVIAKQDEKLCNDIEIKYDKEIYNKDFYIRSL
ncbi:MULTISPECIES: hypothetical protein [Clostridium]|jgi:Fe-S cluster assembly iron-binding protein IscA|uniref:FeS cluster biogenesis domain-containing protein n=2 Tax=root TaxID=1 RepID=R9CJA6_9CLOT|nr:MULTISPECIES: hypothetical protein [Clostridium]EOR27266.1 hypothetical protein A500_05606 [Clostridium sartagoforme AAU1]KLE15100.1 hypothetical protein AAT22_13310 [Clostridium sp. C8]